MGLENGAKVISVLPEVPRKGHSEFSNSAQVFRDGDKRMVMRLSVDLVQQVMAIMKAALWR